VARFRRFLFLNRAELEPVLFQLSSRESAHVTTTSDDQAPLAAQSSFQHLSIGLGFRVIPALGSFAQQFEP
jgi:hypothetical protein